MKRALLLLLPLLLLAGSAPPSSLADSPCSASDTTLVDQRLLLCKSLSGAGCGGDTWRNVTASADWPSQSVYMMNILTTLGKTMPAICAKSSTIVQDTIKWINVNQSNATAAPGNFAWTFLVFQPQYYDMPRKPGDRIESPDTLGRKCWASTALTQQWPALQGAAVSRNLSLTGPFSSMMAHGIALNQEDCQKVICNCFVNASFDPSRSGACRGKVDLFHYLGFDREAIKSGRPKVKYPFHEHC